MINRYLLLLIIVLTTNAGSPLPVAAVDKIEAIKDSSAKTIPIREKYLLKITVARERYHEELYDIALGIAESLAKAYPSFHEAFTVSGDCLFKLNSFNEAYQAYLRALYIQSDPHVYSRIRETLNKIDNARLVTIKLKRNIKQKPNDFVLRNILTSFYIQLGLYDEAIRESEKVISINPWDSEAIVNMALAFMYIGNLKKCNHYLKLASKQGISSDRLHFIRGYILIQKYGNFETGENELIKAVRLNPFSQIYYYNLAYLYMKSNKFDLATVLLNQAAEINPNNKKVIFALAQSYFLDGKINQALQIFKRLTHIAPTSVDGYMGLGKVYLKLKQYDKTLKYFRLAIKFDNTKLKFVNIIEVYFQKYFYLIIMICFSGIIASIFVLKRNYEHSSRL